MFAAAVIMQIGAQAVAQHDRQQARQRVDPALGRPRVRHLLQPLPDSRPQHAAGSHRTGRGAGQCAYRPASPTQTKARSTGSAAL